MREHVRAAAKRDHLADDMRTVHRDERSIPYLVEDAEPRLRRVALFERREPRAKRARLAPCFADRTGKDTEAFDRGRDVVQFAWLGTEHRQAELREAIDSAHAAGIGPGNE